MKRHKRIADEAAEASRAKTGKRTRAYPATLIAEARELERNMAKRRRLRRQLREVEANIRHGKKMLKALAGAESQEEV